MLSRCIFVTRTAQQVSDPAELQISQGGGEDLNYHLGIGDPSPGGDPDEPVGDGDLVKVGPAQEQRRQYLAASDYDILGWNPIITRRTRLGGGEGGVDSYLL
jgi:hypothetical protein